MDTINDIIFSRIGSKKRLRDPDWSKVPIWFHVVDPAIIGPGTTLAFQPYPPQPGIHYAYPGILPIGAIILDVEKEIRSIIDECLNHMSPPCPPAGMVRGILQNIVPPIAKFDRDQRDKFYTMGINPIVPVLRNEGPKLVLWGQKFFSQLGTFEQIIDVDRIHPLFEAFLI